MTNIVFGGGSAEAYTIDQSLRFNRPDSPYLARTFTAGNRQVFTISAWAKLGGVDEDDYGIGFISEYTDANNRTYFRFGNQRSGSPGGSEAGFFLFGKSGGSTAVDLSTNAAYRDPSAWYHVCISVDVTQTTSTDRVKVYVNGVQETLNISTMWAEDTDTRINSAVEHQVGVPQDIPDAGVYGDGYLAEYYFIDGTALTPASFGETDSTTNQWKPIEYSGTYGTNGFYQKYAGTELANSFEDSSTGVDSLVFTPTTNLTVDYLLVAGGGGVGSSPASGSYSGGAGAGGLVTGTSVAVTAQDYSFTVGNGGLRNSANYAAGNDGGDTIAFGITVAGGGGGGGEGNNPGGAGGAGGSGGGAGAGSGGGSSSGTGGSGTAGQGNSGGASGANDGGGGGGGGAGGAGGSGAQGPSGGAGGVGHGGDGGAGVQNSIQTGSNQGYSAGGAGGKGGGGGSYGDNGTYWSSSGYGMGGDATAADGTDAEVTDGTGGVVIVRYASASPQATGGTITSYTSGPTTYQVHTFDNTLLNKTITANGDVANTRAQEKVGDSSIKFDGTGDYLSLGGSSDWDWSASNYTIETWVRPDDLSSGGNSGQYGTIVNNRSGGVVTYGFGFDSSGYPTFWYWDTAGSATRSAAASSNALSVNTWHHIAMVHSGTDILIFVDGTLDSTTAVVGTPYSSAAFTQDIGINANGSDYFDGYLDEIRISDSARYTSSFTPSTTEFTADSNTLLLIHSDWNGGLGADSSGNANDFTATNLVATDQMKDSPSNNFCVLNSIQGKNPSGHDLFIFSEGNLKTEGCQTMVWHQRALGTFPIRSGKWYWEYYSTLQITAWNNARIGICTDWNCSDYGGYANESGTLYYYAYDGKIVQDNATGVTYGDTWTTGDIIGTALNMDDGEITFYKNGTVQNSGTPFTLGGTLATAYSVLPFFSGFDYYYIVHQEFEAQSNFGQDSSFAGAKTAQGNQDGNGIGDFYYEPPADYLALCTNNLSTPEIADPTAHFNTKLYTGDGATTLAVTGVGFQPDFTWIKNRSAGDDHTLVDSVRGATNYLVSNDSDAEVDDSTFVASLDSDGFTVGDDVVVNTSTENYASWNWKAGTANSGSTSGSGTAKTYSSSTSATAGFSVIKYVGNGTSGMEIPHHMGVAPQCLIAKNLDRGSGAGSDWHVWHTGFGTQDKYIWLNEGNPAYASTNYFKAVSSTTFTLGTDVGLNVNDEDFICYAFTGIEGYSKVGSYTGNGSSDGSFIYTGFRPAWFMCKRTNSTNQWTMADSIRSPYNVADDILYANLSNAGSTSEGIYFDFVSNGIKLRSGTAGNVNTSGSSYIYLAFAESPFKYSLGH